jgi:hypothetical protein
MSVSASVLDVADRLALRSLVDRYAYYADDRNSSDVAALFAVDAFIDLPAELSGDRQPSRVVGTSAIADVIKGLTRFARTEHIVHQQVLDVVDGRTSGDVRCTAHHFLSHGEDVLDFCFGLRYSDEYALVDGEWRFANRSLRVRWSRRDTVRLDNA